MRELDHPTGGPSKSGRTEDLVDNRIRLHLTWLKVVVFIHKARYPDKSLSSNRLGTAATVHPAFVDDAPADFVKEWRPGNLNSSFIDTDESRASTVANGANLFENRGPKLWDDSRFVGCLLDFRVVFLR